MEIKAEKMEQIEGNNTISGDKHCIPTDFLYNLTVFAGVYDIYIVFKNCNDHF